MRVGGGADGSPAEGAFQSQHEFRPQSLTDQSGHLGHFLNSFPSASSCFPRMPLTSSSWLVVQNGMRR